MKGLLHILALVAAAVYVYLIFSSTHPHELWNARLSDNSYRVIDFFSAIVMIAILVSGHQSILLMVSLVWLVLNYLVKVPFGSHIWFAYDGFAAASILSQVALPFAYGRKGFMI